MRIGRFLTLLLLAAAAGGVVFLMLWEMPHETRIVEKTVDNGRFFNTQSPAGGP